MEEEKRSTLDIEPEARYRATLASVGDGVILTDAQGRIELLNPIASRMTGTRPSLIAAIRQRM